MAEGGRLGINQGLERGLAIGAKKGKEKGMWENLIRVAIRMIDKDMDIATISHITGLSLEKVKDISENMDEYSSKFNFMESQILTPYIDWEKHKKKQIDAFIIIADSMFKRKTSGLAKEWLDFLEEEKASGATYVAMIEEAGVKKGKIRGRRKGLEKGIEIGFEGGLQEGRQKSLIQTTLKMLKKDMNPTIISDITGLTMEKVKDISESMRL